MFQGHVACPTKCLQIRIHLNSLDDIARNTHKVRQYRGEERLRRHVQLPENDSPWGRIFVLESVCLKVRKHATTPTHMMTFSAAFRQLQISTQPFGSRFLHSYHRDNTEQKPPPQVGALQNFVEVTKLQ